MSITAIGGDDAERQKEIQRLQQRLERLTAAANKGDQQAVADLRRLLDDHPEIVDQLGDLARHAEAAWLDRIAPSDVLTRECVRRQLAQFRKDLAGENPTPLEGLLADHAAIALLAQREAEITAATPKESLAHRTFDLRKVESTQRRLMAAVKTLTQLRVLMPQGLTSRPTLKIFQPLRETA
jgi:AcrR family transcriptional regulator